MQNKGFIKFLAAALLIICCYYLSFSFVVRSYESEAEKRGADAGATYLDSMKNEKVWMWKSLKECQELQIGLGLDLKGGMNVVLEVSVPDVVKALADNSQDPNFVKAITAAIEESNVSQADFITLFVKGFQEVAGQDKLCTVFATQQLKGKVTTSSKDSDIESVLRDEIKTAVESAYQVIGQRINKFGVAQPNIQMLEGQMGRIMVEMPGVKEPERVRKLLQGSANLEFWETYDANQIVPQLIAFDSKLASTGGLVEENAEAETVEVAENAEVAEDAAEATETAAEEATKSNDAANLLASKIESNNAAANESTQATTNAREQQLKLHPLLAMLQLVPEQSRGAMVGYVLTHDTAAVNRIIYSDAAKAFFPKDLSLKWSVKPSDHTQVETYELYAIRVTGKKGKAPLEGNVITNAKSDFDQYGKPEVSMSMNTEGAHLWAQLTKKNVNHSIAIVLDNVVYSAPNVMNEITGGSSVITGNFTIEDTQDLATVLSSGKTPAPMRIVQEEIVGPSLGQESINQGFMSFVIAFVLLMIYMCLIYGITPGLVANGALIMNLFLILGGLASFQAALTMSGIAGIVLSLGMAVDANVLIYERTKEELVAGKVLKKAIADGYGNAFSAIIDSNITSIITGIILLSFGTGPIKGFAITLIIGLLASLFTAVWMTRLVYENRINKDKWTKLTFTTKFSKNMMKGTHFRFMSAYKVSFIVFAAAIVVSLGSIFTRGLSQGIDFSGGRNFVVQFEQQVEPETVTNLLQQEITASLKEQGKDGENATVSCLALGTDHKTIRVSTNYRINESAPEIDQEIEKFLYNALMSDSLLSKDVTLERFIDRDNRAGGSIISSQKVGPSIAKDVTYGAVKSVFFALIIIFIYILVRFRNVSFSIGSTVALAVDAVLIIGTYSLLWGIVPFSLEIDQTFIGAILTCIGYSINDKVVIFDRIRENLGLYPKRDRQLLFNQSLNSTLARTINTSVSTLLVLLCIFFLGGESIRSFAFAMILGVVYGTCSSLFLASPLAYLTMGHKIKQDDDATAVA